MFLSAACIAYYGAFTGTYRQELVASWIQNCKQAAIPVSDDCTLRATLGSPVEVGARKPSLQFGMLVSILIGAGFLMFWVIGICFS